MGMDLRRSDRILLAIPVEVSGRDNQGRAIHEKTMTNLVSKHGARFSSQHEFSVNSDAVVYVPHLERRQQSRVAWVSDAPDGRGNYQVAIELEHAENFWGVQFPPKD